MLWKEGEDFRVSIMLEKIVKGARSLFLLGALAFTGCSGLAPFESTDIIKSKKLETQIC
ncbi:hypothetical protein GF371_00780, partial [Candidatus Woesearchaeota archaeon]|nr:hypothetical protein [Candidatus Woesearchaeota archaeon]